MPEHTSPSPSPSPSPRPSPSIRRAGRFALLLLPLLACSDSPSDPASSSLRDRALAAGLAPLPEPIRPVDNPHDPARIELGRLLFFDPVLSGPRDVACSTCHLPRLAFTDGRQFPSGAGATGLGPDRTDPLPAPLRLMERNSPTVLNVGLAGRRGPDPTLHGTMFWGGQAFGLDDQVLNPIAADKELRGLTYSKAVALDSVLARLRGVPGYVERFADAFPAERAAAGDDPAALITPSTLRRALAAYLRELTTPASPLDAFLLGDETALSGPQRRGLELFIGDAGCVACHAGPLLSDFDMHVLGAPQQGLGRDTTPGDDLGWGEVGGTPYAFRTPPLRQVALTTPYLHAGTAETLEDVIRFKDAGVSGHPTKVSDAMLDWRVRPLGLTEARIADLVAFLHALTDTISTRAPRFQPPAAVPSGLPVPK